MHLKMFQMISFPRYIFLGFKGHLYNSCRLKATIEKYKNSHFLIQKGFKSLQYSQFERHTVFNIFFARFYINYLIFSKLSYIPEQGTLPQAGTPVQGVRSRSCSLFWVFNLGCQANVYSCNLLSYYTVFHLMQIYM